MKIARITAEEITDSRNNPTLNVTVVCEDGSAGSFAVPSGASTGKTEAYELRDGGQPHGHMTTAIHNITTEISGALVGKEVGNQKELDDIMIKLDGTENKSRLGGNSLIGVSVAACAAAAKAKRVEVFQHLRSLADIPRSHDRAPFLYMNLVNGGKHAATKLAFQEYMVVPKTESPWEALSIGREAMDQVDERITAEYGADKLVIGDEGGVALDVDDVEVPLKILSSIREGLGVRGAFDLAMDVAASSFFANGKYRAGGSVLSTEELSAMFSTYASAYGLISIEDPFDETDFTSFAALKTALPQTIIVGDDLTTTNVHRVQAAVEAGSIGAVIIKPNQIGTVSETLETMAFARAHEVHCIVSHRSGETMDTFIADLAYAFGVFGIKVGAPRAKERMAKIDRLIALDAAHKV